LGYGIGSDCAKKANGETTVVDAVFGCVREVIAYVEGAIGTGDADVHVDFMGDWWKCGGGGGGGIVGGGFRRGSGGGGVCYSRDT